MKKYFLLCVAMATVISLYAQKETKKKIAVPELVKQSFAKQYPNTTAKWEKEGTGYEANFKKDGHEMSAVFDTKGSLQETEMEIKLNELPASVSTYVQQHYPSAIIKEAAKITKANGEINYEAEVKHKDLVFTADGKFIKEAKD